MPTTSYRKFRIELYEEYLSNGAFLADQRRHLLAQPCVKWGTLLDWEERLEAQVDGLVVGGELALDVCKRRAVEGELGELETAIRVFVRQSKFSLIEQTFSNSSAPPGPKAEAVAQGLLHERHPELLRVIQQLVSIDASLLPNLARVIGHQRLPLGKMLLESRSNHPLVVWALGRLREQGAASMLYSLLTVAVEKDRAALALALLRITNDLRSSDRWPLFIRGLMRQHEYSGHLLSETSPDSSLGLGLLGDTAAIPTLISRLPQPEAALALQFITGAGLTMQVPLEGEQLEEGERPTMETKIEQDPKAWSGWWEDRKDDFEGQYLCCGVPVSAEALVENLWSTERMNVERYWLLEQLALRERMGLNAEMDMYQKHQSIALPR